MFSYQVKDLVKYQVWQQLSNRIEDHNFNQYELQVWYRVQCHMENPVYSQIYEQVQSSLRDLLKKT